MEIETNRSVAFPAVLVTKTKMVDLDIQYTGSPLIETFVQNHSVLTKHSNHAKTTCHTESLRNKTHSRKAIKQNEYNAAAFSRAVIKKNTRPQEKKFG
jgi:hypothetical protein